jgi:hypothetical protein
MGDGTVARSFRVGNRPDSTVIDGRAGSSRGKRPSISALGHEMYTMARDFHFRVNEDWMPHGP